MLTIVLWLPDLIEAGFPCREWSIGHNLIVHFQHLDMQHSGFIDNLWRNAEWQGRIQLVNAIFEKESVR